MRRVRRTSRHTERHDPHLDPVFHACAANADAPPMNAEATQRHGQVIRGPWLLQIPTAAPSDSGNGRPVEAVAEFFAYRPGFPPPPAPTSLALGAAAMLVPDAALRFPVSRPRERGLGIFRCVAAVVVLLVPIRFLLSAPRGAGAGGIELEAVSIELVEASVLDAQRETREDAAGTVQSVAATTGNNAAAIPPSVMEVPKDKTKDTAAERNTPPPLEPKLEPVAEPVLTAQNADVSVEVSLNDRPVAALPVPNTAVPAIATAAAAAPSGGNSGGAEAASKTAAASVTAAGKVAASQGDVNQFVAGIRSSLARTKPSGRGRFGTALVAFAIEMDGQLGYVRVEKSSGNTTLDQAALEAVRRAAPFRAPPVGMADAARRLVVPYKFE